MEQCNLCNGYLVNMNDGENQIEYTPENLAKFESKEITLQELNKTAKIFYMRQRTCNCSMNPLNENQPCENYGKVVEEIKIYDE